MDTSCLNFLQLCFPQNNWINFKLSCARLYSAFVTYVGDQCDAFFSFFGMKGMELKPWSMNFFVWFTLFDVMLYLLVEYFKICPKKKNWVQMSDKVEISGSNSSKPSSEVSPSTIFLLRYASVVFKVWKGEFAENWKLWQEKFLNFSAQNSTKLCETR